MAAAAEDVSAAVNALAMEMEMKTQQAAWAAERSNQSKANANANASAADESEDRPLLVTFLAMNLLTTTDKHWEEDHVRSYTEDEIISLGFEVLDNMMAGGRKRLNEHRHWKPNKNWWKRAIVETHFKRWKAESPIGSGMWVMKVEVKDVEIVRFLNHIVALVTAINELFDDYMESLSCTVRQKPSEAPPLPTLTDAVWVKWMRRNASPIEQEQIKGFGGLDCCMRN